MNKVYIVFVETESGPDKINKIFKTHEAATNYVKSKCGPWGSPQSDKPEYVYTFDNYIRESYRGYHINIYNVED